MTSRHNLGLVNNTQEAFRAGSLSFQADHRNFQADRRSFLVDHRSSQADLNNTPEDKALKLIHIQVNFKAVMDNFREDTFQEVNLIRFWNFMLDESMIFQAPVAIEVVTASPMEF